ncbi:MAG: ATP-binding cassette domain-containing protein, partial [Alphaproteobacteria bacterium]|nr:ATP-binding cassette domain-containing protein [Alphaproteobacteria bacterium]
GASDEAILTAARLAGAHDMVTDLPQGYATPVGEAGGRLSGGMRQRLAIARALVGDPPVLILDEPSASLDRQAEEDLARVLAELAVERTVVLVTHAPALLARCRHVIVLERGRVLASGPADTLLPRLFGGRVAA